MAEMYFKESCACGTSTDFSGYPSEVRPQILAWRSIHKRHADAISKAIITDMEKKTYPVYYWPYQTNTNTGTTFTYSTGAPVDGAAAAEDSKG